MVKLPAGTTTISGQAGQSRKTLDLSAAEFCDAENRLNVVSRMMQTTLELIRLPRLMLAILLFFVIGIQNAGATMIA
jgi:hypothetical protein